MACLAALPATAGVPGPRGVGILAGAAPHWRALDDESGLSLHLGVDYRSGAHSAELRQEWTFHPIAYMSSAEKAASLSYGWRPAGIPVRLLAGIGWYEDYRLPGVPLAARLELPHLDLEAFGQAGEAAAAGIRISVRAGPL